MNWQRLEASATMKEVILVGINGMGNEDCNLPKSSRTGSPIVRSRSVGLKLSKLHLDSELSLENVNL